MKYDFYITGTIGEEYDWWTGQRGTTVDDVKDFLEKHKDEEVNIAVSSPGGYLMDGITIAELIASHGKCNMVMVGMTASAATILCMKAKSVKVAKGSLILIHNSSQYIYSGGQSNKHKIDSYIETLKKTRENLDTFDKAIADFYAGRNGKTIEENMTMMDKEKWMTAQEALDFGIVDAILDDDDISTKAASIKNSFAAYDGIEEHFGLPDIPHGESKEQKVPKGIMAKFRAFMRDLGSTADDDTAPTNTETPTSKISENMKKIILNLVCALLAVQDIELDEKGTASLTEDQLNAIENDLKEKGEKISNLENSVKEAQDALETEKTAKAEAEQKLADLQKEFDDFKAEAGDISPAKPASHVDSKEPKNAKEMYESIKNLI